MIIRSRGQRSHIGHLLRDHAQSGLRRPLKWTQRRHAPAVNRNERPIRVHQRDIPKVDIPVPRSSSRRIEDIEIGDGLSRILAQIHHPDVPAIHRALLD